MAVKIGNSPESWGVLPDQDPDQTPWNRYLDEVAEAGYRWTELGPYGYLPTDPPRLRSELEARGLGVTAGAVLNPLHDPSTWPDLEEQALRIGDLLASLGATFLNLVAGFYSAEPTGESAGRARLSESEWKQLIETTHRAADLARDRLGLQLLFHPCAGTHVEYEDQIEDLLDQTDADRVSLCLDTGHHAYRGGDPAAFMRKHHRRIPYIHLKSVDGSLLKRVNAENIPFAEAVKMGIMCEPSAGSVDYAGFGQVLREVGYDGFAIVEQDTYRPPIDALMPIAKRARAYTREAGIG